jgi:hypothetical protein
MVACNFPVVEVASSSLVQVVIYFLSRITFSLVSL